MPACLHVRPPVCALQAPLALTAVRPAAGAAPVSLRPCQQLRRTGRLVVAALAPKPRFPCQCMLPTPASPCLLFVFAGRSARAAAAAAGAAAARWIQPAHWIRALERAPRRKCRQLRWRSSSGRCPWRSDYWPRWPSPCFPLALALPRRAAAPPVRPSRGLIMSAAGGCSCLAVRPPHSISQSNTMRTSQQQQQPDTLLPFPCTPPASLPASMTCPCVHNPAAVERAQPTAQPAHHLWVPGA